LNDAWPGYAGSTPRVVPDTIPADRAARVGPPRFELGSDAPEAPSIAKLTHGPCE